MPSTLNWLHISDLHARIRDDWDSRQITEALVRDLQRFEKEHSFRPDFIFFTGDAVFGAVNQEQMPDQYRAVGSFMDAVRSAFSPPIPKRHLYLVPGNHDVDRAEITPDQTDWLRNSDRGLPEIVAAMRDEKRQWRSWAERLRHYHNFLVTYDLGHLQPSDPHLIWGDAREVGGIRIGIAGLNSAWSCADKHDKAKLWCGGDWQIQHLKDRIGPVDFSFALIHHPGNWFTTHEDPELMRHLRQEFPIVFHGHEHSSWVEPDASGHVVLSAGACYEASWMENGYSLGRIDLEEGNGQVWLRRWDKDGRGWVQRDVAGKTTNGMWPLSNLSWIHQKTSETIATSGVTPAVDLQSQDEATADGHYTHLYCEYVISQYDVLELFGCDIPRELQKHQLSVAYVSLNLSSETEAERSVVAETGNPATQTSPNIDSEGEDGSDGDFEDRSAAIEYVLDDVSEGTGRLMIRGPAGAGKSTLLRWCAIHAAQQVLNGPGVLVQAAGITKRNLDLRAWRQFKDANPLGVSRSWRYKIPVLIRLRDCPHGKLPPANELPRFLAKHLPSAPADWMTGILDAGRALVLFDGVDEVHRDHRPKLAEEIGELIRTYPHSTYVVTTRPGAVEPDWLERLDFTEARVEPMGRTDREQFIEKWYRSAALELRQRPRPGEDLTVTATRLKSELADQPELGILASNPLLCAMICALYRERQERLPETPAELSEALVQMLLHRRERETPGLEEAHFLATWRTLQYPQKKGLLAELAWHMVNSGESSIDIEEANGIVKEVLKSTPGRSVEEAPEILEALVERSGLLRPAGDDRIDFLHNTLKEYLAAGRAIEENKWELLSEKAADPAWQPVILFSLALAPEAFSSSIVSHLLAVAHPDISAAGRRISYKGGTLSKKAQLKLAESNARDFFLVRCQGAAKRLSQDLSNVIDKLTARLFPPAYMGEAEALAQLGPRILLHGASSMLNPSWWKAQDARMATRCLRILRLIGGTKATAIIATIKFDRYVETSQLIAEWMLASTELCDSILPWPFFNTGYVHLRGSKIGDLKPLFGLSTLRHLDISWTPVASLEPIAACISLITLRFDYTNVTDISPLVSITSLEEVIMNYTDVYDLSPLASLPKLLSLGLPSADDKCIATISTFSNIQRLRIDRCDVDFLPLTKIVSLKELTIWEMSDINTKALLHFKKERSDIKLTIYSNNMRITSEPE